MTELLKTVNKVRNKINPNLKVSGILLTLVDNRTNLSKETRKVIQNQYSNIVRVI